MLHGFKALNGTLTQLTVRWKCRPWSVELVAAGWVDMAGPHCSMEELSSMPRLELSGLSAESLLDLKLHQL